MDIQERNAMLIDRRISEGLSLLRKYYTVEKCESDKTISSPRVCGRLHEAVRYDIKGVGNLLTMTCKETEENNLSSFVIMPYKKNLPLFSSDFVYSGENRYFLLEIYDLSVRHDEAFDQGIEAFKAFAPEISSMKDIPTRPCWYDDIRPVCYSKAPTTDQDSAAIKGFLDFLALFVRMEQAGADQGHQDQVHGEHRPPETEKPEVRRHQPQKAPEPPAGRQEDPAGGKRFHGRGAAVMLILRRQSSLSGD